MTMPGTSNSDGDTPQTIDSPSLNWSDPAPAVSSSPGETPSGTESPLQQPPASATTSPEVPPANGAGATPQGPIPFDRHKATLDAAYRERDEFRDKWTRVSWAESLAQAGFSQADAILLQQNPVGFLDTLATRLESHPQLAPQIRSLAARILGTQVPSQEAPQDPEPPPDQIGVFDDGRRTPVYSADQLRKWHEWNSRRTQAAIDARLAPMEQERQERDQAARLDQLKSEALTKMQARVEQLRQQPLFVEHERAFQEYLGAVVRQGHYPTIDQAWTDFYFARVHPGLGRAEQSKAIAELQTKAAASQATPRSPTTGTPATITRLDDPRLWR